MLKKITLLIIASIFVLTVFFWHSIAAFGLGLYLKNFSYHVLDATFSSEQVTYHKGQWIFKNPAIKGHKSLAEGGIRLKAEQLTITVTPHFWEQRIEVDIAIAKPDVHMRQRFFNFQQEMEPLSLLGFIDLQTHWIAQQGKMTLYDNKNKLSSQQKIFFQLDASLAKTLRGSLIASLNDPLLQKNCISLSLAEIEHRPLAIDFNFDEVECASLLSAASSFFPALQNLTIDRGIFKGKMALTIPEEGSPYAVGELSIQNLTFNIPDFEMGGFIEEAHIHLDENDDPRSRHEKFAIPRTIGHLELTQEAQLIFEKEGQPFCAIQDLKGAVYFQTQDGAKLTFTGNCSHHGQTSRLDIAGEARFATKRDGSLHLNFSLGNEIEKAQVKFFTRQLGTKLKFAEISFANIGPAEFDLLMAVLTPHYPESRQVHMSAGKIDATALAYMKGLRFTELKIEKIAAHDLQFHFNPWEWSAKAGELSGNLAVNLDTDADKALDTLNADLLIKNGQVKFATFNHDFCYLADVQTQLTIRQGTILDSIVQGEFAGLKGTIKLDGLSPDGEVVKLNFYGDAYGLATLAPEPLRTGLRKKFSDDQLSFKAGVKLMDDGIKMEGLTRIGEEQNFEFGFELNKASEQLWGKWPVNHLAAAYWQHIGQEAALTYLPAIATPIALFESKWMKGELGIAGFVIKDGWFQAEDLELDKYLSPLLFPNNPMKMEGKGDVQGSFNHSGLVVHYDLRSLTLENNDLILEVKNLENSTHDLPGTHFIDFISGTSYGSLPIHWGTYFEKNTGLLFSDIQAQALFVGKKIELCDLQTTCNGLHFSGKLEADFSSPLRGLFDVNIDANAISGQFSQLQQFLAHFEKLKFFQKFPFDGQLELSEQGFSLRLGFHPEQPLDIQTAIKGKLKEGIYVGNNQEIGAKNLSLNFDYNQSAKTFDISDMSGTLIVGKADQREEYVIAGDLISFSNLERNEAEFDLWAGDNKRDIVRIVGKTYPNEQNSIQFVFDKELTHFGDVHPTTLDLSLKNWSTVDNFYFEIELSLASLLHDLQSASRTGLFCLPPSILKKLNDLKEAKGNFAINLNYDSVSSAFGYHALGEHVEIGPHQYKKCALHGIKKGCTWSIDQLILDQLTLAADLTRKENSWNIDFMGLRYGDSLLAGLEGEYRDGDSGFDAKVNLLEANLSKLNEWPTLQNFVQTCHPGGLLRAAGHVRCDLDTSTLKGWKVDALVSGSLRSWEFKGLHFQDAANVSFHLVTDQGIAVEHLKTSLRNSMNGDILGLINAEKINYSTTKDELNIGNLQFNIPFEHVKKVTTILQKSFPEAFTDKVTAILSDIKQQGNLEGSFSMAKVPSSLVFQFNLREGTYRYLNHDHDVNNFVLKYDLKELKILTQYRFNDHIFWLTAKTRGPQFDSGILVLSDHHPEQPQPSPEKYPLRVDWKNNPETGFQIYRALGHFAGLAVNLTRDSEIPFSAEGIYLVGEVGVNPSISASLISEAFCIQLKNWQIDDGYRLNGNWRIGKQAYDETGRLHFTGLLEGYDFTIKGYQFQKLSAQVHYIAKSIELSKIKVEDPAGIMAINQADIYHLPEGNWAFHIPKVTITSFRPSLLQEVGQIRLSTPKPLLVRNLEIENLTGYCDDMNTFTGKGKLQFVNPPKKNLQNTILAIPAEILTMIGLDLTVLNPISGTIFYEIGAGKVHLTRFKDVYSEGRLSKFHLSNSEHPSYMDFDGKLHISIRMKQYNLFFKLAELFTFNIGGTLKKPTYSLQNPRQDKPSK